MQTYKATVRVPNVSGSGSMVVWAQVSAQSPIAAKSLLDAQYGRSNLIGIPVRTT